MLSMILRVAFDGGQNAVDRFLLLRFNAELHPEGLMADGITSCADCKFVATAVDGVPRTGKANATGWQPGEISCCHILPRCRWMAIECCLQPNTRHEAAFRQSDHCPDFACLWCRAELYSDRLRCHITHMDPA